MVVLTCVMLSPLVGQVLAHQEVCLTDGCFFQQMSRKWRGCIPKSMEVPPSVLSYLMYSEVIGCLWPGDLLRALRHAAQVPRMFLLRCAFRALGKAAEPP